MGDVQGNCCTFSHRPGMSCVRVPITLLCDATSRHDGTDNALNDRKDLG